MSALELYYVESVNDEEEFDLFVIAEDDTQAIEMWRQYWDEPVRAVHMGPRPYSPNIVIKVPVSELLIKQARAIHWDIVHKR